MTVINYNNSHLLSVWPLKNSYQRFISCDILFYLTLSLHVNSSKTCFIHDIPLFLSHSSVLFPLIFLDHCPPLLLLSHSHLLSDHVHNTTHLTIKYNSVHWILSSIATAFPNKYFYLSLFILFLTPLLAFSSLTYVYMYNDIVDRQRKIKEWSKREK